MDDAEMCRRAYAAGISGGNRLIPLLTPGMEAELMARILFDGEDVEVIQSLAENGNVLATSYLTRKRQRSIEEELGEPG